VAYSDGLAPMQAFRTHMYDQRQRSLYLAMWLPIYDIDRRSHLSLTTRSLATPVIYGALATSHKGKSRVDAEADFDRLFICIVGVECGVM
jgi:hypothetical protein